MPHARPVPSSPAPGHGPAVHQVILLEPMAPRKPPEGADCNGCGVCCTAEPCPLGRWLSRRQKGACHALLWDAQACRYRCAALTEPGRWWPRLPTPWARWLVRRWIAAARGCDCSLRVD